MSNLDAKIEITAKDVDGKGFLVSMKSSGDYADALLMDARFFSYDQQPTPDVSPLAFWGKILHDVGISFMRADAGQDDEDDEDDYDDA